MAAPWPTHRVKAAQAQALRRRRRRRQSAEDKAAHLASKHRERTAP